MEVKYSKQLILRIIKLGKFSTTELFFNRALSIQKEDKDNYHKARSFAHNLFYQFRGYIEKIVDLNQLNFFVLNGLIVKINKDDSDAYGEEFIFAGVELHFKVGWMDFWGDGQDKFKSAEEAINWVKKNIKIYKKIEFKDEVILK